MRFLVDAQLPRGLALMLEQYGHDAIHTSDLPQGNSTPDREINRLSLEDERVVITKDSDFFYSHLSCGTPWKLLLVKTGNIGTRELKDLIERNLPAIESALRGNSLVEINRESVTPRA